MRCSVLQCVAVHCSIAACCSRCCVYLPPVGREYKPLVYQIKHCDVWSSSCRSVLQRVAAYCSIFQRVAVRCSMLQCLTLRCSELSSSCRSVLQRVAACCSMSQCVAVCCRLLQCVVVCCSVSHCDAVSCSALTEAIRGSLLRKSSIKDTIFCKRDPQLLCDYTT